MKQLIALSQKNKKNRVLCPILQFQNLLVKFQLLTSLTSRLVPVNTN